VTKAHPTDRFFEGFVESCRNDEIKRRHYRTYDDALRILDEHSWQILKDKAVKHFTNHRSGQLKQGFFNQLNEAFAYRHLVRQGCDQVRMLPESQTRTPDIRYKEGGCVKHCEVKTLGISDEEIRHRASRQGRYLNFAQLADGFFKKFQDAFQQARGQITAHRTEGLVYFVVIWDDFALDYYTEYREQVLSYCRQRGIRNVYIKVGLRGNRRITKR
jgi:hypothetical protein